LDLAEQVALEEDAADERKLEQASRPAPATTTQPTEQQQ